MICQTDLFFIFFCDIIWTISEAARDKGGFVKLDTLVVSNINLFHFRGVVM